MSYPAGVQTVTLRLGSSFDSAGTLASISGHVVPMFGAGADHLVWSATGQTYAKVRTNLAWDDTEKVALATVPHPTQAGWRDQTQATFSGWSYQISAIAVYASGERHTFERTVTPLPGDTVIDVDLLPNGAAATPTVVAEWEAARADALAALAATEVEQVTLTDDLAYTLPAGVAPNRVHSVVFTQDGVGGHTVTYGGQPVAVDLTAGAATTVEMHPVGAGYVVRYPTAVALSAPAPAPAPGFRADVDALICDASFAPLTLPSPYAITQQTHPSVALAPQGFGGYTWWLASTPYDGLDNTIENPCIYASNDGDNWVVPAGLTNPIDPHPGGTNYNSDTHLAWGPDGKLYCFWRTSYSGDYERIHYRRTSDGVTWEPKAIAWENDKAVRRPYSPAVQWEGTRWVMYFMDGLDQEVRRTTSPDLSTWATPVVVTTDVDPSRQVWHIDVQHAGGQWYMLIMDRTPDSSGGDGKLYLASSADGLTFHRSTRELVPQRAQWHTAHYRGCIVPTVTDTGAGFEVYHGGIIVPAGWHIGHTRTRRSHPVEAASATAAALRSGAEQILPFLAADTFNRADEALIGSAADSGHTWVGWNNSANCAVIGKQAGSLTAANTKAVIDLGTSDHYVEVQVKAYGTDAWLVARGTDTLNHVRLGISGGTLQIQHIAAGAASSLLSNDVGIPAAGMRIGLLCKGDQITVYRDGRAMAKVTTTLTTGTFVGWQTSNTTTRFDNLWARALVAGE